MDTRRKILTGGEPLPPVERPVALATGYFDILRVEHARELARLRQSTGAKSLVVIVLPLVGELMEQAARARMVAALRVVDYVLTICNQDVDALIFALHPVAIVRLETGDRLQRRQLIEHVRRRQNSDASSETGSDGTPE